MDLRACWILSLCSGIGGLDLGVKLALPAAKVVCYVEREAFACEVLATAMEKGWLDQAPLWSDLRTFDGKSWRGAVDCLTAGYPCQPFSKAGRRLGKHDERHLWPEVARIIEESDPGFCFLENVPNHLPLGFEEVHHDLERMGYQVAAGLFTTVEVGGPIENERLFILAAKAERPRVARFFKSLRPCGSGPWRWCGQADLQSISYHPFKPGDRFPEPLLRRVAHGSPAWLDRLRAVGNTVVPQAAARALGMLAKSL